MAAVATGRWFDGLESAGSNYAQGRQSKGGTSGAPLKPLTVDSVLRALSTLRGLRGAPEVPPLCRETQSL